MTEPMPPTLASRANPNLSEDRKIHLLGTMPVRMRVKMIRAWRVADVINREQARVMSMITIPQSDDGSKERVQ